MGIIFVKTATTKPQARQLWGFLRTGTKQGLTQVEPSVCGPLSGDVIEGQGQDTNHTKSTHTHRPTNTPPHKRKCVKTHPPEVKLSSKEFQILQQIFQFSCGFGWFLHHEVTAVTTQHAEHEAQSLVERHRKQTNHQAERDAHDATSLQLRDEMSKLQRRPQLQSAVSGNGYEFWARSICVFLQF